MTARDPRRDGSWDAPEHVHFEDDVADIERDDDRAFSDEARSFMAYVVLVCAVASALTLAVCWMVNK